LGKESADQVALTLIRHSYFSFDLVILSQAFRDSRTPLSSVGKSRFALIVSATTGAASLELPIRVSLLSLAQDFLVTAV